ncbi:hypothetical protein [Haloechinothrix sp. LS1_15]|uniref:hypothetical protein n=1 Tax=Haloechinothrix sp. LS1_15 TaxID=2652248 RepID=UPI00294B6A03|nr:hypothetical protein [Haloechinothrix sp. LS1_15]
MRDPMTGTAATTTVRAAGGDGEGLRLSLAFGAVLIGYSYLVGLWPSRHGTSPAVVVTIREWVNLPLGIGEDFGMLGIGLLLIAFGYHAPRSLCRLGPARWGARLLVGGYLPYLLAVTLSWVLLLAGVRPLADEGAAAQPVTAYLSTILLADRLTGDAALLQVGWVVAACALFAALLLATAFLLRVMPLVALLAQLGVVATITVTAAGTSGWYAELGLLLVFLAYPLSGEVIWAARAGLIPGWAAVPLGAGCFALLVAGERAYPELAGWLYALTLVYAVIITLIAMMRLPAAGSARITRWLATRSYALLLLTGAAGYPFLSVLAGSAGLPLAAALPAALAVTAGAADLFVRSVRMVSP